MVKPKEAWLRINVQPGMDLLEELCDSECYYNGDGYIRVLCQKKADEAISLLRGKGYVVTRTKPPAKRIFTGWSAYAVGSAIDYPKRIFV